jgi:hypothetical protein
VKKTLFALLIGLVVMGALDASAQSIELAKESVIYYQVPYGREFRELYKTSLAYMEKNRQALGIRRRWVILVRSIMSPGDTGPSLAITAAWDQRPGEILIDRILYERLFTDHRAAERDLVLQTSRVLSAHSSKLTLE